MMKPQQWQAVTLMSLSRSSRPSEVQIRLQKFGSYHTIADGKKREVIDAYLSCC